MAAGTLNLNRTDNKILRLGEKIRSYRINLNITQKQLAAKSGVSLSTVIRLESGASIQLEGLIKIIDALGLGANLELLIPEQSVRPSDYLYENTKERKRASSSSVSESAFKWGDEK